ncbi:gamma-aminobutyric acid receptor subunit alpha-1-like [Watersipora subatra]|uniref:gamma-aminobutyric acid receptor subunit alpha-1-like n=1 Tax=Watersipora subatra TaxID=2589382 RepID=UPI00355AF669
MPESCLVISDGGMVRLCYTQKRTSSLTSVFWIVFLVANLSVAAGSTGFRPQLAQLRPSNASMSKSDQVLGIQIGKNMSKVLDDILVGYDVRTRPFPKGDQTKPTQIQLDLNIRSMGPISEMDRSYSMDCYFRQTWNDPRLVYSGASKEIAVHIELLKKLWTPDTYFYNGKNSYLHRITTDNKLLRISPDGTIFYSMRLTIKADCPMKLHAYPMDTQECMLTILSFSQDTNLIQYSWKNGNNQSIVVNEDVTLSQFDITSYSHVNGSTIIKDTSFSSLTVTFKLKRRMGYFLLQIYVPSILLVTMSWVTFWLNREATSDRVGLGITVILTLTTMSRGTDQDLPQVPYVTALELYVQMCFTFLILSMVEFVGVHYFTKHGGGDYHNMGESSASHWTVILHHKIINEPDSEDERCDEPTEAEIQQWKAERKREKARKKKMKQSKLVQGIGMISMGSKYKEVSFGHKLLSCLKGSHKYRDSMRRRARRAGHLANSSCVKMLKGFPAVAAPDHQIHSIDRKEIVSSEQEQVTPRLHQGYTKVTPRLHQGYTKVTPRLHQGYTKVTPRLHQGYTKVTPRLHQGYTKVTPRLHQGYTKVTPRLHQGYTKVTPRLHQGYTKVTPRLHQGYTKVTPRLHQGYTKVTPRLHHGYTKVTPWLHQGYTLFYLLLM